MVALDTNVIVRLLTNDDPAQVARARRVLEHYNSGLDFADAMHLAFASMRASTFASSDVALARRAAACGAKPPVIAP